MIIQNNFSNEFKFLINFLFNNVEIKDDEIANLNLDRLIQIGSRHLLLPLLFYKLEKKKLINSFPQNFTNYIHTHTHTRTHLAITKEMHIHIYIYIYI